MVVRINRILMKTSSMISIYLRGGLVALVICILGTVLLVAQPASKNKDLFAQDNLVAWCIVPFDNQNRTPTQRIEMLKRLNFSQYAYDWRPQHLPTFAEEIKVANEHKVHIAAVWMWIDKGADSPGQLSKDNETLLGILRETGLKTQLWVGFNNNFYEYDKEETRISKGVEMLTYLKERTKSVAGSIALYNHGDWFGETGKPNKDPEGIE